jgi:hypothetical protein
MALRTSDVGVVFYLYSVMKLVILRIFLRELGLERGPLSLVIG